MKMKVLLLCLLITETMPIVLKNGRYEDLYIVIQDDVVENDVLLKRIQNVFTAVSKKLFTATRNQMYFGQIKVIIPKTWSPKREFKRMVVPSVIEQPIFVESTLKGTPRVYGLTKCGSEGSKMYLNSPTFLLKEDTLWGKHENVIVHEWGHLRFGLYDEYPVVKQNYKRFYQADGKWNPVRCTEAIRGDIGTGAGCKGSSGCNTLDTSKVMDSNCRFCPYVSQEADASLMGSAYIDALSMYCDKNDPKIPEKQRHNSQAPNMHNIRCDYLSAWEVMRKHKDFQNMRTLPSSTDTTPTFEFIQVKSNYRVLVLDVSGSMKGNRLENLHLTSTFVIQTLIPKDSWLGIVTFNDQAKIVNYLTEIKSQEELSLEATLPRIADGSTCIGCGIDEAIKILKLKLPDIKNCEIIVVSDGDNNEGNIESSRQMALRENVIIHTISVTQDADILLADIAEETGGYHLTYLEIGSTSFMSLFASLITGDITAAKSHAAMLAAGRINATSNILTIRFPIENGLGKDTSATVLSQGLNNSLIYLTGPGNYYEAFNTTKQLSTILIPGIAKAGDYVLTIDMSQNGSPIEYFVQSTPTSYDILQVSAKLSTSKIDLSSGDLPIIFAEITKGYSPVLNATMTALVEAHDGSRTCDISLNDKAMDPDGSANDGMYSGYIQPSCLYAGRVTAKILARGQGGETMIRRDIGGSQPIYSDEEPEVYEDTFQRVAILNDLYIENYIDHYQNDTVSPGRITDVSIHDIVKQKTPSGERRNFTISWRATGDDKNVGQASAYILKISNDFQTLLNDFDSAKLLDMKNFTLRPQKSGENEALRIVVDAEKSYTSTAFFAIKAVDEVGNVGDVSNILSIVVAEGYRVYGGPPTKDNNSVTDEDDIKTYIIIGSVGGSIILMLCLTMIYCRRRAQSRNTENPDMHMTSA